MNSAAGPQQSDEVVVLIPKRLRMEWMDALALDPELSPTAYKVAGLLGRHFNRYGGGTFIKQETIARMMGLSLRTVQNAVIALERRGYLIVRRRELGFRASDGRRAAGGKGVANTYLPAFKGMQVASGNASLKEAMDCALSGDERTQNRVSKDAAFCHPTLKTNPLRERARVEHQLGAAGDLLCRQIGDVPFRQWFTDVQCEGVDGDTVRLSAPSAFVRSWLIQHHQQAIVTCWQRIYSRRIERVEISVHT